MVDRIDAAETVRLAISHFVEDWPGGRADLMTAVSNWLRKRETAIRVRIPGGRTDKSLSAWLRENKPQLPTSAETLCALLFVSKCSCLDEAANRRYTVDKLKKMHADAKNTPKVSPKDLDVDDEVARRVLALSDATAMDCDVLVNTPTGLRLRLSDVYVERNLEDQIVNTLRVGILTAVRGEAGFGKTVLLWRLRKRLTEAGRFTLLIPATALLRGARGDRDSGAVTVDDLWRTLRVAKHRHRSPVLLVDTVDLLTHSPEARVEVTKLVRTAAECRVPMVVTCRPAEAALLHLDDQENRDRDHDQIPIRPLHLKAFNDRERREAVELYADACYGDSADAVVKIVQDAQLSGRPLLEVVANPLTLRMLFELYASAGETPDPDIDSIGLYTLMWIRRVVKDQRAGGLPENSLDLSADAKLAALAMLAYGQVALKTSELLGWMGDSPAHGKALDMLVGRAVLARREETHRLWFQHQTWFEHAAARAVAGLGPDAAADLAAFVAKEPYDLLFGEVASQLLLLAGRTAVVSVALAEKLLTAWLRADGPGVLILALRTYARFRDPSAALREVAAEALARADDRTCKDFLRLLPTVSHSSPERWLEDLAVLTSRNKLRLPLIETLIRLAAAEPQAALAFVKQHDCLGWLLHRPQEQLRDHDSVYLRLLDAVAPDDPQWATAQAMRFWHPLSDAGTMPGLADVTRFLVQQGEVDGDHYEMIASTVRGLQSTDNTTGLQRAFADMVVLNSELSADLAELLEDNATETSAGAVEEDAAGDPPHTERASEVWRRVMMRAAGKAMLTLAEGREVDSRLGQLLAPPDPRHADYYATALAELLAGSPTTAVLQPAAVRARQVCQEVLSDSVPDPQLLTLFTTALKYARLDGATLLKVLPVQVADHTWWFDTDPQGVLVVEAAAVGNPAANAALRWLATTESRARTAPALLRKIIKLLQGRVENAPSLFAHVVAIAHVTLDSATMCSTVERLPADIMTKQPDVLDTIRSTRTQLVADEQPHIRVRGYVLWRALVRNGLDEPPRPEDLGGKIKEARYQGLLMALINLGVECVDNAAWPEHDVPGLIEAVKPLVVNRVAKQGDSPQSDTRSDLARRLLVGLMARIVPLPTSDRTRRAHVSDTLALTFDAGYDVTHRPDLNAFTTCATPLGWLVARLIDASLSLGVDALLTIAEKLHALHPEPAHWRQSLGMKWQYTITTLINDVSVFERQRVVEHLLRFDVHLVSHAVTACVTREQKVRPWILQIVDHLPDDVRGRLRSSIFEHARELSHRSWDSARWIGRT